MSGSIYNRCDTLEKGFSTLHSSYICLVKRKRPIETERKGHMPSRTSAAPASESYTAAIAVEGPKQNANQFHPLFQVRGGHAHTPHTYPEASLGILTC